MGMDRKGVKRFRVSADGDNRAHETRYSGRKIFQEDAVQRGRVASAWVNALHRIKPRSERRGHGQRVNAAAPVAVGLDADAGGFGDEARGGGAEEVVDAELAAEAEAGMFPREPVREVALEIGVELNKAVELALALREAVIRRKIAGVKVVSEIGRAHV